jgi:hypothetical protein
MTISEELSKIHNLYERGIITGEEYVKAKEKILNGDYNRKTTDINFECGPDIFFVTPYTIELVITGGTSQNGKRIFVGPSGKNLEFILRKALIYFAFSRKQRWIYRQYFSLKM